MKKVLILFPDSHLPYSPSTLNLKYYLKEFFEVKILAFKPVEFKPLNDVDVHYINYSQFLFRVVNFIMNYILFIKVFKKRYLIWRKICILTYLIINPQQHVIAVDLKSLELLKNIRKKNIHFFSLELYKPVSTSIFNNISSIIIQNNERLIYLTNNTFKGRVFFIQNAPSYAITNVIKTQTPLVKLIYCGTAKFHFGIQYCLEFINKYDNYNLTIKGHVIEEVNQLISLKYKHLIEQKRVIVNTEYLSEIELINFVSRFDIGFCFYDFSFPEINNYNYTTAPSGKMFTYMASAVPTVGIDIIGLNPISENNCGIKIPNYSPVTIKIAVDMIMENYTFYSDNALDASKKFAFNKSIVPFIDYLKEL